MDICHGYLPWLFTMAEAMVKSLFRRAGNGL